MTDIRATIVATFMEGQRQLMILDEAGTYPAGRKKDGTNRTIPFEQGDVALTDGVGHILEGPINFGGAYAIAVGVIEGNPRVICDSASLRTLALAVAALATPAPTPPPPTKPAAEAMRAQ